MGFTAPLAAAAWLAFAAGAAPTKAPRNVVLIVVDALRPDHLGAYGYGRPTSPSIDLLAAEGIVFENAITQANWTLPALASIMTSLYPSVHGASGPPNDDPRWHDGLARLGHERLSPGRLDESRLTWAEILRARGFATAGFVGRGIPSAAFGFGQGFDAYVERATRVETLGPQASRWIAAHRREKFFLYVHVMDVHDGSEPAGYASRWDPGYRGAVRDYWGSVDKEQTGRTALSPGDSRHLAAIYDGAVSYADEHLGAIFKTIESAGLAGDTVVIVTADHGEEFLEHGLIHHGHSPYDALLKVPLIWREPGLAAGMRVKDLARSIDILPTALDLLTVPAPAGLQGRSLRPLMDDGPLPAEAAFSETADLGRNLRDAVVIRTLEWKLIHPLDGRPDELYRVSIDPLEERDLIGSDRPRARALLGAIARWRARCRAAKAKLPPTGPAAARLDDATRESLRRMGYLP